MENKDLGGLRRAEEDRSKGSGTWGGGIAPPEGEPGAGVYGLGRGAGHGKATASSHLPVPPHLVHAW